MQVQQKLAGKVFNELQLSRAIPYVSRHVLSNRIQCKGCREVCAQGGVRAL